jgi:hypothetical protein
LSSRDGALSADMLHRMRGSTGAMGAKPGLAALFGHRAAREIRWLGRRVLDHAFVDEPQGLRQQLVGVVVGYP